MDELGDQDLGIYGESQGCKPSHMDGVGKILVTIMGGRATFMNAFEPTGGLYTRLVIHLEQWQWTYQFGWERVDHL